MVTIGQCCFLIFWTIFFTTFFAKAKISLPCDSGWLKTPSGANCVKKFKYSRESWYDARRICKSIGGDLVTIRDKDKSNFIKEQFVYNNHFSAWIGLHKFIINKWHWLDEDVTPTFTDWRQDPALSFWTLHKQCAVLKNYKQGAAAWFNWMCGSKKQYICEKSLAFQCDHGWVKTPGFQSCIKIFGGREVWQFPFDRSRWFCQKLGGHLETIRDDTKSNFIRDRIIAHNNFPVWIGLHKLTGEDRWHWLDEGVM
ncbi:macrophage mannose receptor 1-like, partial [Plakobranchus ocellatus]